jgi:GNAT superfamily N-acetyltransferase
MAKCTMSGPPIACLPRIRAATRDDAARIHEIHAASIVTLCAADYTPDQIASWTRFRSVENYRAALESGETNWVAVLSDDTVVAYATYVPGELTALFVDPAHARRGAGRLLLRTAEAHARAAGLTSLTLQSTLTSRAFYEHHGYAARHPESYTLPDGVRIECVRMTKPL